MQVAYAALMENPSPRRLRRQQKLNEVVRDYEGGATALAAILQTPKSHLSAMQHGRRGVGDAIAARIEHAINKPPGWMDQGPPAEISEEEMAILLAIREAREKKAESVMKLTVVPKPPHPSVPPTEPTSGTRRRTHMLERDTPAVKPAPPSRKTKGPR